MICLENGFELSFNEKKMRKIIGKSFRLANFLIFYSTLLSATVMFFIAQCYFVLRGKTMWEQMHGLKIEDDLTLRQRIKSVFGPWFLLNFIYPTPWTNRLDSQSYSLVIVKDSQKFV